MKSKQEIFEILRKIKTHLRQQFKVKELWAFGSLVTGERTEQSDVDLLVDFEEGADLLVLSGLGLFLEEQLGCVVDIVPRRALRLEIKDRVLRHMVAV